MVAVVGQDAEIVDALMARAELMETTGPTLKVALQNQPGTFEPPVDGDGKPLPYLEARIIPSGYRWEGLSSGKIAHGSLVVNLIGVPGMGIVPVAVIIGQIKAHFPKNTVLTSGATKVRIDKEPRDMPETPGARPLYPVIIPYVVQP